MYVTTIKNYKPYFCYLGAPGAPGAPNPLAPGMGPQVVNRRMNAIKTNHPKDMMGPNMGKLQQNKLAIKILQL